MRLLSEDMLRKLPSRDEVRYTSQPDLIIYHHIYNPIGIGDWFVIARDRIGEDVELFVIEALNGVDLRTRNLRSMSKLKFTCGQRLKRDKTFKSRTLTELREDLGFLV